MHSEHSAAESNPERPPFAPYDPPEPAPQAAAWRRALKVVGCTPPYRLSLVAGTTTRVVNRVRS